MTGARARAARAGCCSRPPWSASASSPRCCRPARRAGFALVYLLAAPTPCARRIGSCSSPASRCSSSAGWWVAVVELWPAASRPYIGGSQDNSILNLIFGYNGFGRLTGNETGSVGAVAGTELWRHRERWTSRVNLSAAIALTTWWAHVLLGRTPTFESWLRPTILVVGIAAAVTVLVIGHVKRGIAVAIAAGSVLTAVGAPVAFAIDTASTPHTGSIPSAGPSSGQGGPGGFGGRGFGGGQPGAGRGGTPPTGTTGGTQPTGTTGGTPPNGAAGFAPPTGTTGTTGTTGPAGGFGGGRGQGGGGLLGSSTPSAALTAALKANASSYTWVAAAVGSNEASGYQLATGDPVMAIGGFNGSDPDPTLAQFEKLVAEGKIHYFIAGSVGTPNGGSNASSEISTWVSGHYTAVTIGGVTLYDLTKAPS
jgi:hypothetical protein